MIKLILVGANGAMGQTIAKEISKNQDTMLIAGVDKFNTDDFYENINDIEEDADVIIDFSSPDALDEILAYAKKTRTNLVLATTGYSDVDHMKIDEASKEIAIVQANNYSVGVNIMAKIAKEMARILEGFDIEIVEAHHRNKKDAPSGTANMLFEAINDGRDEKLYKNQNRLSENKVRDDNEVGMSSIRAGSISGDHSVIFAAEDEVLTLSHHAASKKIFAIGALKSALFVADKSAGRYDFSDVLDLGDEDD